MNTYDINSNQHILEKLIDKALLDAVVWITKKCTLREPQEPDYVAALSTKFAKDFSNVLVAVFPDYDFSVVGIPIGNGLNWLYSSRRFPPVRTVHDSFPSHGAPSIIRLQ